jgi:hypothetical protein
MIEADASLVIARIAVGSLFVVSAIDKFRLDPMEVSLVASFRALVHSVTIHPNGPREGFEIEPSSEGRCFPKQSVVGDTW